MRRHLTMILKFGIAVAIAVALFSYYMLNEESEKLEDSARLKRKGHDTPHSGNVDDRPHKNKQTHAEGNVIINEQENGRKSPQETHGKGGNDIKEEDKIISDDLVNVVDERPRQKEQLVENHGAAQNVHTDKPEVNRDENNQQKPMHPVPKSEQPKDIMHLAVVACGERLEETLVMLKSARLLSKKPICYHIFAEDKLHKAFKIQLDAWPADMKKQIMYKIYPITYPANENAEEWKKVFKPCATQRLFLPDVLDIDALVYVDTDVLFMRPLDDLWAFFSKFNSTQMATMTPEHEDSSMGWYNRFARHPYYGKLGMNSGVMLMNLTRFRNANWINLMVQYYKEYKLRITWGDQDLINIFFHYHPDKLHEYPCPWNYRPDHCMYMSNCKLAEQDGAYVVHGNRGYFHSDKQPAFKAVYTALKEYQFGDDLEKELLPKMKSLLEDTKNTPCGSVKEIFTKQLEKQIKLHTADKTQTL